MKYNRIVLCGLILLFCLSACAAPAATSAPAAEAPAAESPAVAITLKVFAPSSLTEAAKELAAAYEKANPEVKLAFEFGHTPTQRLQFTEGASGEVFITASQKDMDDAIADKTVAEGSAKVFARNQLVIVLPAENKAEIQSVEDLAKPGVHLLVAVTDTPIGKVTVTCFDKMDKQFGTGFKSKVEANIVSKESGVKPIVSKIKLGEADAGIVYVTDAVSAPELKTLQIPAELNMITQLNVAPLVKAANAEQAAQFAAFMISDEAQVILKKWGFLMPKP
jgi:molybdate transport system substrate-binding protein